MILIIGGICQGKHEFCRSEFPDAEVIDHYEERVRREMKEGKEPLSEVIRSSKDDLNIRIGSENMFKQLEKSSVVVAKYSVNGDNSGSISVVGPTRMDYKTVISSMKYLTDLLGRLITSALEE